MKKILDKILIVLFIIALVPLLGCEENNYGTEEPVDRIELQEVPLSDYIIGDMLDITNMVVTIVRESGKEDIIHYEDFERMGVLTEPKHGDRLELSNEVLKVMYAVSGNSLTHPLTVDMPNLETEPIKSIKIKQQPERNYYINEGDLIDLTGLVLTVSYDRLGDIEVTPDLFDDFFISSIPAQDEEYSFDVKEILVTSANYEDDVYLDLISDPVFIYASDFSSGLDGWIGAWGSGIALSTEDDMMKFTVNYLNYNWQDASVRDIVGLVAGRKYQLSIRAKSLGGDRSAATIVQMNADPWVTYTEEGDLALELTSEFKMYTSTFVMGDSGGTGIKMQFNTLPGEAQEPNLNDYIVSEIALIELSEEE